LAFLAAGEVGLLVEGLSQDHQLVSAGSLATLLFGGAAVFAFGGGGDFGVLGALDVDPVGWAMAFAISSWALVSSSTARV
jgi:hypothetical protein